MPSFNAELDVWQRWFIVIATEISPDDMGWDFCVWGYIKDLVYEPTFPKSLKEHKEYSTAGLRMVDNVKLQNVWN